MTPRRVLLLCVLIVQASCAANRPRVQPPTINRWLLPQDVPGKDQMCVQIPPSGRWACLPVEDVRELFGSLVRM